MTPAGLTGDGGGLGQLKRPTAIDLFAGAGGTTLGLRHAGFDVRVAVDSDQAKASVLSENHPKTEVLGVPNTCGDVTQITGHQLSEKGALNGSTLDLLVACPPCQGYSLQGRREADDPRNYLYLEFVRLASELRPRAVAFENVPGMASLEEGFFLADLLDGLAVIGYEIAIWRLKASDLGVPQTRERIFVIGLVGVKPGSPPRRRKEVNVWDAIADLPVLPPRSQGSGWKNVRYRGPPRSAYAARLRGNRKAVAGCERTRHQLGLITRFRSLRWEEVDHPTRHRRLHPRKPAPTLTAGSRTRTACRPVHPFAHRVLTVREAARLTSFPDWYEFPNNTAEAWSQIGNSVPPTMARAVFIRLRSFLSSAQHA